MTVDTLLKEVREDLRDTQQPYLLTDAQFVIFYNAGLREFFRKAQLVDSQTLTYGNPAVALNQIELATNTAVYALDANIIEVLSVKLSTDGLPLVKMTTAEMETNFPNWVSETADKPLYYILDYENSKITLYPKPSATYDTANIRLIVTRLPLTFPTATSDLSTFTVPIAEEAYADIPKSYVMYRVLKMPDAEVFTTQTTAKDEYQIFLAQVEEYKRHILRKQYVERRIDFSEGLF